MAGALDACVVWHVCLARVRVGTRKTCLCGGVGLGLDGSVLTYLGLLHTSRAVAGVFAVYSNEDAAWTHIHCELRVMSVDPSAMSNITATPCRDAHGPANAPCFHFLPYAAPAHILFRSVALRPSRMLLFFCCFPSAVRSAYKFFYILNWVYRFLTEFWYRQDLGEPGAWRVVGCGAGVAWCVKPIISCVCMFLVSVRCAGCAPLQGTGCEVAFCHQLCPCGYDSP